MKLSHIFESNVIDFDAAKKKRQLAADSERDREQEAYAQQVLSRGNPDNEILDALRDYAKRPPDVTIQRHRVKPSIRPVRRFSPKWHAEFIEQISKHVSQQTKELISQADPEFFRVSWANREDGNKWLRVEVYTWHATQELDIDERLKKRIEKVFKRDIMQAAGRVLGWYVAGVDYGGIAREPFFRIGSSWFKRLK